MKTINPGIALAAVVANHNKCLCTSGIDALREMHAGSVFRRSLRKRLFLLGLKY